MALTAPPQQDDKKSATKEVEFEGTIHEFPADFTDEDIRKALSSLPKHPPEPTPNSFWGGMGRRAVGAVQGLEATFNPVAKGTGEAVAQSVGGPGGLALYRTGRGIAEGYKQKATELASDLANKNYGKAALHGAQIAVPAIGPASPTGSLIDTAAEGRYREALGGAAFDAITTWLGMKMGRTPTGQQQLARLTAASGGESTLLEGAMPEIVKTAQVQGQPLTLGKFIENVKQSDLNVEAEFNQAAAPVNNQSIMPTEISTRIRNLEKPNMAQTAEGRETIKYIRKMAREYEKPWTIKQLTAERMQKNAELSPSFYKKGSMGQSAAMKSSIDTAIDKAVRDGAAEATYREIARANPGLDVTSLKKRQGALWELKDHLNGHYEKLRDSQLIKEGTPLSQKLRPGTYVSAHGIHGYVSHLQEALPGGGDLDYANANVRRAFQASPGSQARRAAVLSLPIAHALAPPGFESSKLPPPPSGDSDE